MKAACIAALCVISLTPVAHADVIGTSDIIPTTALPSEFPLLFPIEAIADGISSDAPPYNGFAAIPEMIGTIHLDLVGDFDLTSFTLWNDINVFQEGIQTFQLHFFDSSDSLLTSSPVLNGPLSQVAPQVYPFATEEGVSRVDLEVLSLHPSVRHGLRLEIREVEFGGTVPTSAPLHPDARGLSLGPNFPNPFNPTTRIPFVVPSAGQTSVTIYDVAGNRVRLLVDRFYAAGAHAAIWNGRDDAGVAVSSGVYFCRLEHPTGARIQRLVLVK